MTVKITSDSTCDLSEEILKRFGISVIPLTVLLGEEGGRDGIEVSPEDIYRYIDSTGNLPKTSAVNAEEYKEFLEGFLGAHEAVIHFSIGQHFSSSFQNASLSAGLLGNVFVIDSENLSTGQGLLVVRAAEMASAGSSASEICEEIKALIPKVESSFVIDRLDNLYKGGRCSGLAALGANILKIKPCIEVLEGEMSPTHRYRGLFDHVIRQYVRDRLEGRSDIDTGRIFVTHTKCSESLVEEVKALVRELCPGAGEILETVAGSTVTTHCGANTLGVLFIRK